MRYQIYNTVGTTINGERLDLTSKVTDENGKFASFTLLKQKQMTESGDEFFTGNMELVSLRHIEINDNRVMVGGDITVNDLLAAVKILETIKFIQTRGWGELIGREPMNPRMAGMFANFERIANNVDLSKVENLQL